MNIFKTIGLYIFAAGLFYAGVTHFIYDHGFARMLPGWVPLKLIIVYVTGITEWLLALLLIFPQTRRAAGFGTTAFLVLVLPANIYAAIYGIPAPWSEETPRLALWIRPLFQPLLIWWVLVVSKHSNRQKGFDTL
ncbi:DoxX family protein [Halobacillus mangrovi]|uniref:DoxX family protein n=1 Tax=Halobacillus mangrovi TaxID=402384 RepID=A0A1W6A068_9BACI|nr:hypothetical protein [Halobacillus mangrovi]ARI78933.1 hypothetical protein HM131_19805 [Halobacillus mangrovi]